MHFLLAGGPGARDVHRWCWIPTLMGTGDCLRMTYDGVPEQLQRVKRCNDR